MHNSFNMNAPLLLIFFFFFLDIPALLMHPMPVVPKPEYRYYRTFFLYQNIIGYWVGSSSVFRYWIYKNIFGNLELK